MKWTAADNRADLDSVTIEIVENNFYVEDCLKYLCSKSEAVWDSQASNALYSQEVGLS